MQLAAVPSVSRSVLPLASSIICVVYLGLYLVGLTSGRVDHVADGEVAMSVTTEHGPPFSGGGNDLAQLVFLELWPIVCCFFLHKGNPQYTLFGLILQLCSLSLLPIILSSIGLDEASCSGRGSSPVDIRPR